MDRQSDMTKLMVAFIIFQICLKIENCIYGQGCIIFFNNTPSEFTFRFIIKINHIQELLFRFLSSFDITLTMHVGRGLMCWSKEHADNVAVLLHE
jgi:hypothetical protein